jgi:hypothetical protein
MSIKKTAVPRMNDLESSIYYREIVSFNSSNYNYSLANEQSRNSVFSKSFDRANLESVDLQICGNSRI